MRALSRRAEEVAHCLTIARHAIEVAHRLCTFLCLRMLGARVAKGKLDCNVLFLF